MGKTMALLFLGSVAALLVAQAFAEGDPQAGKQKSAMCGACHGPQGISMNPIWPTIAGQKDQYLIKQLKAFRDGNRKDPLMSSQATGLTDADMTDLAAYYSRLPCGP